MSNDEPIFFLPGEDPAFLDAAKRAQESFRYFWREVAWEQRRIIPALGIAAVKAPFVDPPGTPTGGLLGRLTGKKTTKASEVEHEMALAGSMASVELLLEFGGDPHLRNEAGLDAIQLAESMGWARVAARLRAA